MAEAPLTSVVVSSEEAQQAEKHLERLLSESDANSCLLLDHSGQIVARRGRSPAGNLVSLGALLAGTFAAAREVARALGEDNFNVFFQQGRGESMLTQLVGQHWLLAVFFDQRTPLGLAKVLAARTAKEMEGVLKGPGTAGRLAAPRLRTELRVSIEQAIDSLFKD